MQFPMTMRWELDRLNSLVLLHIAVAEVATDKIIIKRNEFEPRAFGRFSMKNGEKITRNRKRVEKNMMNNNSFVERLKKKKLHFPIRTAAKLSLSVHYSLYASSTFAGPRDVCAPSARSPYIHWR